ncbi:alginate export family protein [Sphingomonas pituitosa]|uniref:alginate export family protein n=1 Tax=Sphingomonas pituitosa TaxID=99597 RepID=UPI000A04B634|nr:alginate export family protein [Sphingomonas pituitosa]
MVKGVAPIAALLAFGAAGAAQAQGVPPPSAEGLTFAASERVRVEAIDGQARAGFNDSDQLVNFRTTLLARYQQGAVSVVGELWDSRVYNGNRGSPVTTGEVNTLEPVQAYVQLDLGAALGRGSKLRLQVGRFMLNLGSRRLVAADDYRNTTNGYTGVRADWSAGRWAATAIYTMPQRRRPDDLDALLSNQPAIDREGAALVLWGGLISRARTIGPATIEASYFHLGEHDTPGRPTRDRSLDTASVRIVRDPAPAKLDYEIEAIGQTGSQSGSIAAGAARQAVRAWFVHARAGYSWAGAWKPRLMAEFDYASGDAPGGSYGRFDTLFGMRRADLAPAGLYNAIARSNVVAPSLQAEAAPDARTDLMLSYRPMWLAARTDAFASTGVRDARGRSGDFAGHQLDGRVRYRLSKAVRLEADAVLLAKGRFLRDAPNAPPERWTKYGVLNLMINL